MSEAGEIQNEAGEGAPGEVWATLQAIRTQAPLVHSITNLVAMDLTANLLLAAGASPVMAHASEEVEAMAEAAGALNINIGTLDKGQVEVMVSAVRRAVEVGVPWVLDPVGVGATALRQETAERLSGLQPAIVRANASEIAALAGAEDKSAGKGVDTTLESWDVLDVAQDLSARGGAVVAVSGAVDYVTDGQRMLAVANGHAMMTKITGMGCALSALMAAALAAGRPPLAAALHALVILGVGGEIAAERAEGPGSFRWRILDAIYEMDEPALRDRARVS